jgi:hypothetical protein
MSIFGDQRLNLVSKLSELLSDLDVGPETFQKNPESDDGAESDRIHQVSAFLNNKPHFDQNSLAQKAMNIWQCARATNAKLRNNVVIPVILLVSRRDYNENPEARELSGQTRA